MEIQKVNSLYHKLATQINQIIPGEWEKVWLYAEVLNDASEVYFYFLEPLQHKITYCHDIPKIYGVSADVYEELLFELLDTVQELCEQYQNEAEHSWESMTFSLASTGEFAIEYEYENLKVKQFSAQERQIIWEYKVVGIQPTSIENQRIIERYEAIIQE
ncbi:MAG: immunity protein YezG family protein [Culicoidibacterales bacterium]